MVVERPLSTSAVSAAGHDDKWTLSSLPVPLVRFRQIASDWYGVKGAMTCATVVRQVNSVSYAARLSASIPFSADRQKRSRERRTYQFESASTNALILPVAV